MMGVSYNGGRGVSGYSVRNRTLRECNSCGFRSEARYNTHHKYVAGKKMYCGYMRVVR